MSHVITMICDGCQKEIKSKTQPHYIFKLHNCNIKGEPLRLPFGDMCAKCTKKIIEKLGGTRTTWTREELKKKTRAELRDITSKHWPDIKGRDKEDLIQSLEGKPIEGPEAKEEGPVEGPSE